MDISISHRTDCTYEICNCKNVNTIANTFERYKIRNQRTLQFYKNIKIKHITIIRKRSH